MAWANVSGTVNVNSNAATSPWAAGTLSASVADDTRLVAFVNYNSASGSPNVTNITDSLGNTWVKETDSGAGSVNGTPSRLQVWSTNSVAGTPAFTVTFSGGSGGFGIAFLCTAYSGTRASSDGSELDISLYGTVSGATTYDSGTTAGTTTEDNELKIGAAGDPGTNSALTGGTLDGTYTSRVNASPNGNAQAMIEDRDSGATGSTARATVTIGTPSGGGTFVAVFKLSPPPPPPPYDPGVFNLDVRRMIE